MMIRAVILALAALGASAQAATPAEILVRDEKSQPESLTVRPDGPLIAGSAH